MVWVCVLLKVHPFVFTLATPKLHSRSRAQSNLKRGEASHHCTYGASSLAKGNHHEAKPLITERAALLPTREAKASISRAYHLWWRCSISRSIPPRADMLHIENPDRDLYRRTEGAYPFHRQRRSPFPDKGRLRVCGSEPHLSRWRL